MAPASPADLSTRVTAGVVMAAVACVAVYYGGWPLRGLVTLAAIVMLVEYCDMKGAPRRWAAIGGLLLAFVLLAAIEYLYPAATPSLDEGTSIAIDVEDFYPALIAFAGIAGIGIVLAALARRIAVGWGFVYVAIPAFALLVLSWAYSGLVFWIMAVTWATDIFAYFAGRAIGGPRLAPRLSPNKTWAGLIGGMIGAGLAGWAIARLFDLGSPFTWIGAPMGAVAQLGDLYESWEKRRAGVKDSGTLLPGHGGVLDRLDGLLAVSTATFLLLVAGLWTA
jgi:phosphatidate cytidylyltransferase